jgi:DNA repair protein RadA/Sms
MTRTRVRYGCEQCGAEAPQWLGRCTDCGEWGTVVEVSAELLDGPLDVVATVATASPPVALADVDPTGAARRSTEISEFDRVLGGGFVAGSVTLLGGEPGVGKSTLLLQAMRSMAHAGTRALLVAAEESPEQVRLRAERIGPLPRELLVVAETSLPAVLAHVAATKPDVLIVDSIQSVTDPNAPGVAGSVTQVRDCTQALVRFAKEYGTVIVLVGHVTKDGALAGPRALEHLVDTVLQFEGDRHHALRMLRAVKHRFGPTGELGIFEMAGEGLRELADASAMLLTDRQPGATGSVVVPVMEGSRPLLVEMQALVTSNNAPMPRRQAQSFDTGRLAMLIAVLEQRGGIDLKSFDVFASVVGGVRVAETGADLGLLLAIASTHLDRTVPPQTVVVGEVGLGGEVRSVPQLARRLAEAARIGFLQAIVPESAPDVGELSLVRVRDVRSALAAAFAPGPAEAF